MTVCSFPLGLCLYLSFPAVLVEPPTKYWRETVILVLFLIEKRMILIFHYCMWYLWEIHSVRLGKFPSLSTFIFLSWMNVNFWLLFLGLLRSYLLKKQTFNVVHCNSNLYNINPNQISGINQFSHNVYYLIYKLPNSAW